MSDNNTGILIGIVAGIGIALLLFFIIRNMNNKIIELRRDENHNIVEIIERTI